MSKKNISGAMSAPRVLTLRPGDAVMTVGPSGSGKSTFLSAHFEKTQILSTDAMRGVIADDVNNQECSGEAHEAVAYFLGIRAGRGMITALDATFLRKKSRDQMRDALKACGGGRLHVVIFNIDPEICEQRVAIRGGECGVGDGGVGVGVGDGGVGFRDVVKVPAGVSTRHSISLRSQIASLRRENFASIIEINHPDEVATVAVVKQRREATFDNIGAGRVDIIGDVHGCFDELANLAERLGYIVGPCDPVSEDPIEVTHPEGRKMLLLGDLVDRGPRNRDVLRFAMGLVHFGTGDLVLGNHDAKFARALGGADVKRTHGLEETMIEIEACSETFRHAVCALYANTPLVSGLKMTGRADGVTTAFGVHAALPENVQDKNKSSGMLRNIALYGVTTGETTADGFPERLDWAADYAAAPIVLHGHTPMAEARSLNRVICLDTGCVFGGKLSALRLDLYDANRPESLQEALVQEPSLQKDSLRLSA